MNKSREDELWAALGGGPTPADLAPSKPVVAPKIRNRLAKAKALPAQPVGVSVYAAANPDVVAWLESYKGNFPFYLSLRDQYRRSGNLSEKQTVAVKRAIDRERPVAPVAKSVVPKVAYTIRAGEVIRVGKFIAQEIGKKAGLTRAHFIMEVVEVLAETPKAYRLKLRMSSQRSGHCCVCGLKLTNVESLTKGIGPICGDGYALNWNDNKDVLLQLAEKLRTQASDVETWIPKSSIKERLAIPA